jgi:excisionase family DNA binding protein
MTQETKDGSGIVSLQTRIANHGRALTAKELADLLNVSPVTVFKQAKKGLIPSFRIGTCVRFEPKKTAEWLSKQ